MTSRYGRSLEFGLSIVPASADIELARSLARRADELGLDLIAIQDHPYQRRFLDTWSLMADLLARTERIRVFPDVANLPLRGAAMIAKQAATLDVLSGGRFELGLGAGAFWEAIGAMGGPVRSGREALAALEEAIRVIRAFWSGERTISVEGEHYSIRGLHPGPCAGAPNRDLARRREAARARPDRTPRRRLGSLALLGDARARPRDARSGRRRGDRGRPRPGRDSPALQRRRHDHRRRDP